MEELRLISIQKKKGENWYAWSFYIDDSKLTYTSDSNDELINNHTIQFGQMKLSYENEVFHTAENMVLKMFLYFNIKKEIKD